MRLEFMTLLDWGGECTPLAFRILHHEVDTLLFLLVNKLL